jgi:hypothetical protein
LAETHDRRYRDGRSASDPREVVRTAHDGQLAWGLWALAMILLGFAVVLMLQNRPVSHDGFLQGFLVPGFATVGAVVAARRRNTIGWLFLGVALVAATGALCAEYALRARVTAPGSLPAGQLAAWAATWVFTLNFPAVGWVLLLFPDGRLPSPRWRPVAWGLSLSLGVWALWLMIRPGPIDTAGPKFANPFALSALPPLGIVTDVLVALNLVAVVVTLAAAVFAPFWRRRRANAVERQQLKWLAFVALGVPLTMGLILLGLVLFPAFRSLAGGLPLLLLVAVGIPATVGLAVLRYRLYDIDRLINRTLVYGLLTAVLGLCYVAGGLVLALVIGAGSDPPSWLVAGATLAAAAIFRPARRNIQAAVDRRFNRRKYNAAQTIQAFSTRLREQIDLDTLSTELLAVTDQTMEPTRVSLWLRPPRHEPLGTAGSEAPPTSWAY